MKYAKSAQILQFRQFYEWFHWTTDLKANGREIHAINDKFTIIYEMNEKDFIEFRNVSV